MCPQAAPQGAPTLLTGDLRLVAPDARHEPMLVQLGLDEACQRWGDASPTGSPGAARSWVQVALERWREPRPRTPRQWVVEAREEGVWRGAGTAEYRPDGHGAAEVGYAVHAAFRGQGVATRALDLALGHGFASDGLHTARWRAEVGNWPARRVAWRLGFSVPQRIRGLLPGHDTEREPRDGWVATLRHDEARAPAYPWLLAPTLHGEEVVLRAWRHEDAPRIVQACTDPRTRHYLPSLPHPYGPGEAMVFIDATQDAAARGAELSWCVAHPGTDRCVGAISLMELSVPRQAEIGYWAHPQARGRGVLSAANRAVSRYALASDVDGGLGLDRVFLRAAVSNAASLRVARAAGMTEVGRDRRAETLGDGTVEDLVRFDLLAGELANG